MTLTMKHSNRWTRGTALSLFAALTLAACGGSPPPLPEISSSAKETMQETVSFTYTREDPADVHGQNMTFIEWSGQTSDTNFHTKISSDDGDFEFLIIDDSTSFIRVEPNENADNSQFSIPGSEGKWLALPESEAAGALGIDENFGTSVTSTFGIIEELSEEELDTVEVEEIELSGESVYKYVVPATANNGSGLYTGSETVAFYFDKETSRLIQVDATSGEDTATHVFSDFDEIEPFEAPDPAEIADFDWTF